MIERDRLLRVLVPAVLVGVAGILMFVRLDEPARIVFDETYYVNDARDYLNQGVEEGFAVHPPVGKWIIAGSIQLLGDTATGWRAAGAFAGSLSVLLTYLIGLRLFRRMVPAVLAGLLLATDGLFLVQARTSMLDIFLGLFTVLGAWLLLKDHDDSGLGDEPRRPSVARPLDTEAHRSVEDRLASLDELSDEHATATEPSPGGVATLTRGGDDDGADGQDDPTDDVRSRLLPRRPHPWRALAGVAFGLAIATKWSGGLPLAAAGLLALGWELGWRKRHTGAALRDLGPAIASLSVGLVLVPVATYALTWVPWLVSYEDSHEGQKECVQEEVTLDPCPVSPVGRVAGLARYHHAIWRFHTTLEAEHSYRAPAYTWPVLARPVVYYYETCSGDRAAGVPTENDEGQLVEPEPCVVAEGEAAEIIALGNPALWWGFLLTLPLLAAGIVRRDRRALYIAAFWGVQFLPWLIVSRPVFFFYMVPVVPFLALGLGYAVATLSERRPLAAVAIFATAGTVAGWLSGFAFERQIDAETTTARWIVAGVGWALGAAVGALADRREHAEPRVAGDPGRTVAVVTGVLAVALLIYFLPVWTGIPIDADAVRQRWWFRSWI